MAEKGNKILTQAELAACKPILGEGGRVLRAYCPFHGSDNQRSLRVDVKTGHFRCFACDVWGYMAETRQQWQAQQQALRAARQETAAAGPKPLPAAREAAPTAARPDLEALLSSYQTALPGSLGAEYLERRCIPWELAQQYGLGYAAAGQWPGRDWRWGRLVFPHTGPDGQLLNLYGRAVGADSKTPKTVRHDHLSGAKGYFNAGALLSGEGPLFVCEGAFDALALIAAGYQRAVAIFGVNGWRWEWARQVQSICWAFDQDAAGKAWRDLARQAILRGKQVSYLSAETYGGHKDASAAWTAGALRIAAGQPGATTTTAGSPTMAAKLEGDLEATMERQGYLLIDSAVLGEAIALAKDSDAAQTARQALQGTVVYTVAEAELFGGDERPLRAIHKAKRFFGGTVTERMDEAGTA